MKECDISWCTFSCLLNLLMVKFSLCCFFYCHVISHDNLVAIFGFYLLLLKWVLVAIFVGFFAKLGFYLDRL